MSARRIALVAHSPWMGGAERCLLDLAGALRGRREVHVLLPRDGALRDALDRAGVATHVAPARWWAHDPGTPAPRPEDGSATAAALERVAPDVVVSSTLVHPAGALAAWRLGIPHVWWVHEFGRRDHGFEFARGYDETLREVHRRSRAVVVASRAVAAELGRVIPRAALRLVPYAVDVPAAARAVVRRAPAAPRLVILGRVRPSKGQQDAVRALAALRAGGIPAQLDVAGAGDVGALRALAAREGVADAVRLHGERDDAMALLDAADVALTCSRDEAFGRITVEAMKRGRPVVGARSGGTAELIDHGRTGLTYAPGDHEALAGAVAALLADDDRRARIAEAGRRFATETFTRERQASGFLRVLDEAA